MPQPWRRVTITLTTSLLTSLAQAGSIEQGVWTPTHCGEKPAFPGLDLSSVDAYNQSVTQVNAYRKSIRVYLDCLTKEANADIQLITNAAAAQQHEGLNADAKILADVKAAEVKFR